MTGIAKISGKPTIPAINPDTNPIPPAAKIPTS